MIPEHIKKALGNPGIWMYTKESNYEIAIKLMDEKMDSFHDKSRGEIKVKFSEFNYKHEITEDDFFSEPFEPDDIIIGIWMVNKSYLITETTT